MALSEKAKASIKTALAMTLAYGIALAMDWDNPHWAGIAVAMVSLSTIGQSINKAALRMVGTLVAVLVAFLLIGLFAQERWLFMVFLSAWLGLCTYMMGNPKHQYFWHVGGFVCVIVAMSAGPNAQDAFSIAVLRAQETGLGILVYTLVAMLLWPSSGGTGFHRAVTGLASAQHKLFSAYLAQLQNRGETEDMQPLQAGAVQAKTRFDQLLSAAQTDDYQVWELRGQWRRYHRLVGELAESLERWRECFAEVRSLDLPRLMPNLTDFGAELGTRLDQVDRMLAGDAPERHPVAVHLDLNEPGMRTLSHFQRAAMAVTVARLRQLEDLTQALFDCVSGIQGFAAAKVAGDEQAPAAPWLPDPDRIASVIQLLATVWLAYLALIYVDGLPGGAGFLNMVAPFGMILAATPQLPVSKLFLPTAVGVLVASIAYLLLMPHLSGFLGLGALIFVLTFAFCYRFAAPQQALGRALGLAMFAVITGISNQQTYSFLAVANTALMFPLLFLLLAFTAHIPFSARPERAFMRLLRRYFRSSRYLLSIPGQEQARPSRMEHWRRAFHRRELATLPAKLGAWARFIDPKAVPDVSPAQVQTLVSRLQALTYRLQELQQERDKPQAPQLSAQMREHARAWRQGMQDAFERLTTDPAALPQAAYRGRLDELMNRLEDCIRDAIGKTPGGALSDRDQENFYRLLGAYRGLSEAMLDYAGSAQAIDWVPWQQQRFA